MPYIQRAITPILKQRVSTRHVTGRSQTGREINTYKA